MKIVHSVLLASLMLDHAAAHATSFDCNRGRSVPEQLICHTADLSKLDDQLGKLYWQARRRVIDPKDFRTDSDRKWAWREANCRDEACLRSWYSGRIEELQQVLASLPSGPHAGASQASALTPLAQAVMPAPVVPVAAVATVTAVVPGVPGVPVVPVVPVAAVTAIAPVTAVVPVAPALREIPRDISARAQTDDATDTKDQRLVLKPVIVGAPPSQCTAAELGIDLRDQCTTVLKQDAHWHYEPRSDDWFCGMATLAQTRTAAPAQ